MDILPQKNRKVNVGTAGQLLMGTATVQSLRNMTLTRTHSRSTTGDEEPMEFNVPTEGASRRQVWQDVSTTGGQSGILLTRASR